MGSHHAMYGKAMEYQCQNPIIWGWKKYPDGDDLGMLKMTSNTLYRMYLESDILYILENQRSTKSNTKNS